MIAIEEPHFIKEMDGDSFVGASVVKNAFGIIGSELTENLIKNGLIPKPTKRRVRGDPRTHQPRWKVSELREAFIK